MFGRRGSTEDPEAGLAGSRPYSDTPTAPQTSTVPQQGPAVTDMVDADAPSGPGLTGRMWASTKGGTKRYIRELGESTYKNPWGLITTGLVVADLATRAEVTAKAVQTAFATNPPDNTDRTQLWRCRPGSAGVNDTMVQNFPNGTTVCCPEQLHIKLSCPNDDDDDDGGDNSTASGANVTVWDPNGPPSIFVAASTFDNVGGLSLQQPLPTNCSAMSADINLTDLLDAAKSDACDVCGGGDD